MIVDVFMAVVLVIALFVVFLIVRSFFGAVAKIIIAVLILVFLITLFLGLDLVRDGRDLKESTIIISNEDVMTAGFEYYQNYTFIRMNEDDFNKIKTRISNKEFLKNETIFLIERNDSEMFNKERLELSDIKELKESKFIKVLPKTGLWKIINFII